MQLPGRSYPHPHRQTKATFYGELIPGTVRVEFYRNRRQSPLFRKDTARYRVIAYWKGEPLNVRTVVQYTALSGICGERPEPLSQRAIFIGSSTWGSYDRDDLIPMPGLDVPARYPPFRGWTVTPPEWRGFVFDEEWLEPHLERFGDIRTAEEWRRSPEFVE